MAMNREMRRMLQRQGQVGPDGEPVLGARGEPPRPVAKPAGATTKPAEFLRDVRSELRRVAWPTRAETVNYSIIVLITIVVLITLIFVLDTVFAKGVLFLFKR